jgi:hypothetical protein
MFPMKLLQKWLRKTGLCLLIGSTACTVTWAQDVGGYYSNRRVFSGFVEYSNDSSHMLLGYADGRKISAIGAGMERRSFLSNHLSGAWVAEVRPFMTETDPTMTGTPLNVILITQSQVYAGTATYIGGTRSTYVTAFSPLGYKLSAFPSRRIQPFVTGLGGFAVATRDIPVFNSSAFNYTFEFGGGVEWFQTHTRSCRFEYRYHHLANTGNAAENPGIDSGVLKVTYSFGR